MGKMSRAIRRNNEWSYTAGTGIKSVTNKHKRRESLRHSRVLEESFTPFAGLQELPEPNPEAVAAIAAVEAFVAAKLKEKGVTWDDITAPEETNKQHARWAIEAFEEYFNSLDRPLLAEESHLRAMIQQFRGEVEDEPTPE